MRKEIGGFIEFEHFHGAMLHESGIRLNSAQNCLRFLIREKRIQTIWLPYFLCESITEGCRKENTNIYYYHVDHYLQPLLPDAIQENEWIYLVNYYGQLRDDTILSIQKKHPNLILDNVQAYFHPGIPGIPSIYSPRKYFGVADGGIILGIDSNIEEFPADVSWNRMEFLLGRFECGAADFYQQYVKNNDFVGSSPIKRMSSLTENLLRGTNYEHVRSRREINFRLLHDYFRNLNQLKLTPSAGPFMYPLLVNNGAELRKKLIAEKIFIPKLWPLDQFHSEAIFEKHLAEKILPLPCDQRYDEGDMKYLADKVMSVI